MKLGKQTLALVVSLAAKVGLSQAQEFLETTYAGETVYFAEAAPRPTVGSSASGTAVSSSSLHLPQAQLRKPLLPPPTPEAVLSWDALMKEATLKSGEFKTNLTFALTNASSQEVVINSVRSSCGCTVPRLPSTPWKLAPGENGILSVEVDVRGKVGVLTKTVMVDTSSGYRYLTVRVSTPGSGSASPGADSSVRVRNLKAAMADRQAVFKGDCARCHSTPGEGKLGRELYIATCGVCHEAVHRASMVPNLRTSAAGKIAGGWRPWIEEGKGDSLMPAWSLEQGGPLTAEQVDSLVEYLDGPFRKEPAGALRQEDLPGHP